MIALLGYVIASLYYIYKILAMKIHDRSIDVSPCLLYQSSWLLWIAAFEWSPSGASERPGAKESPAEVSLQRLSPRLLLLENRARLRDLARLPRESVSVRP